GDLLEAVAVDERPRVDRGAAGGAHGEQHGRRAPAEAAEHAAAVHDRAGTRAVAQPGQAGVAVVVAQRVADLDADARLAREPEAGGQAPGARARRAPRGGRARAAHAGGEAGRDRALAAQRA